MNNSSKLSFAFIIMLLPCSAYSFSYNELDLYKNNLTILYDAATRASFTGTTMLGAMCLINLCTFFCNCEKRKDEQADYASLLSPVVTAIIIGSLWGLSNGYKTVLKQIG